MLLLVGRVLNIAHCAVFHGGVALRHNNKTVLLRSPAPWDSPYAWRSTTRAQRPTSGVGGNCSNDLMILNVMPALDNLDVLQPRLIAHLMFGSYQTSGRSPLHLYRLRLITLVDRAVREYEKAREYLLLELKERQVSADEIERRGGGQIMYMFACDDHVETCINATHRALRFLERVNSEVRTPVLARDARRLLEASTRELAEVRNCIEHMDEHIQSGRVHEGQPIGVKVDETNGTFTVTNLTLSLPELAVAIRQLHAAAVTLMDSDDMR